MTYPLGNVTWNPFQESGAARSVVLINGESYLPVSWNLDLNAHGATDTAEIVLPIKGNPDFSQALSRSDDTPIYVQIYAGYPDNPQPKSLDLSGMYARFSGVVDMADPSFDGNTISFTCRSLAAPLISQKLTSAPMGMTSVQFAQKIAGAFGMSVVAQLDPGIKPITLQQMLGRELIGGSQFNGALYHRTAWDVLLQCAMFDNAYVWVTGGTLYYCSPSQVMRNVVPLQYGRDLLNPVGKHALQFNKNIRVEILTYQRRVSQSSIVRIDTDPGTDGYSVTQSTKTVTSSPVFGTPQTQSTTVNPVTGTVTIGTKSTSGGAFSSGFTNYASESAKELYRRWIPNIDPATANQLAVSWWKQLSQHEYSLTCEIAMTREIAQSLSITSLLDVSGLPYANFNTLYYPLHWHEQYDQKGVGWRITAMDAVNHQPAAGAV